MFKKSSLAVAAVLLASSASSFAATNATANLNVTATLTPVCTVTATNISLSYISFQNTAATNTGPLTIKCTSGQNYNLSINKTTSSVLGLNYSVDIVSSTSGASVSTGVGTGGDDSTKVVKATIAAGQGGTASGADATYTDSVQHMVTVSY